MAAVCSKGTLPDPHPLEIREKARLLYEQQGLRLVDIESEIGINRRTVANWKRRDSWQRKSESSALAISEPIETDMPDTIEEAAQEYETNMRRASVIVSRRIAAMEPDAIVQKADRIKQIDATARKALKIETEKPRVVIDIGVLAGVRGPYPHRVPSGLADTLHNREQLRRIEERMAREFGATSHEAEIVEQD